MELSVVIPFYNEEDNIEPLLLEVKQALDGQISYEIVAVDDGSTDKTLLKLNNLKSSMPELMVMPHSSNKGQSTAIVSGVRSAKGQIIATLDGDGQNDPADILTLLKQVEHQDIISGKVFIAGNRAKRNDSWSKRISSRLANHIRRALLHDDCLDTGCSLKIFPRDIFLLLPHFDHLHRFMPALFRRAGVGIINIPVNHRARTQGLSKYGVGNRLWVGIRDMFGVRWLQSRECHSEVKNIKDN